MLSEENRKKISDANIWIFDYNKMVILLKKRGSAGNVIPNWESGAIVKMDNQFNVIEEITSDCPKVSIQFENDHFLVSVWDWVPGPGPGDFELKFDTEEEAVDMAFQYFFTKNKYFEERLNYQLKR